MNLKANVNELPMVSIGREKFILKLMYLQIHITVFIEKIYILSYRLRKVVSHEKLKNYKLYIGCSLFKV